MYIREERPNGIPKNKNKNINVGLTGIDITSISWIELGVGIQNNHYKTVKNDSNSKLFMKFACLRLIFFFYSLFVLFFDLWIMDTGYTNNNIGPPTHKHTNIHFYCNILSEIVIEINMRRKEKSKTDRDIALKTPNVLSIRHQTPKWHTCDLLSC